MCRTGLSTGWHYFRADFFAFNEGLVYPVEAKGAFLNYTVHPVRKRPNASFGAVRRKIGSIVFLFLRFLIIKASDSIGASYNAVFAAYTPPEVLYHYSILAVIGGFGRTDCDTGGVFAVHARHGYELDSQRGVLTATDGNYLMPEGSCPFDMFLWRTVWHIILCFTGNRACLTAGTLIQVYDHSPFWHILSHLMPGRL